MGIKKNIITDFSSGTPSSTYSVATGYTVGSEWINTNNGNRFYHKTDGNWVPLNVESIFYVQGGTSSAFDTTSSVYRTGSLNIGTTSVSDSRFVVSSSTGSVSLVVGENGVVSIGGTSSSYPLTVYGTAQVTGFFYTNVTQVSTAIIFDGGGGTGIKRNNLGLEFFNFATSSSAIRFTNNGYNTNTGDTTMLVDVDKKYVGLGTSSPSNKLHVYATQSGALRLEDGTQGNGYILTSDTNGVASWTASLAGLSLLGNSEVISTAVIATASVVVYDYTLSSLWYHGTASSDFTANFINLPTTDNRVLSATIVISQGATAYIPNIVQIAGVTQSIKWAGGTQSGTTNSLDLISFNFIRTGNVWTSVIGQIAPFS